MLVCPFFGQWFLLVRFYTYNVHQAPFFIHWPFCYKSINLSYSIALCHCLFLSHLDELDAFPSQVDEKSFFFHIWIMIKMIIIIWFMNILCFQALIFFLNMYFTTALHMNVRKIWILQKKKLWCDRAIQIQMFKSRWVSRSSEFKSTQSLVSFPDSGNEYCFSLIYFFYVYYISVGFFCYNISTAKLRV